MLTTVAKTKTTIVLGLASCVAHKINTILSHITDGVQASKTLITGTVSNDNVDNITNIKMPQANLYVSKILRQFIQL